MYLKLTFSLVVFFSVIHNINAQVKIGDNSTSINPFSLLELESKNKTLVLTRVTSSEMESITPLAGALVFNTDENCIYQYINTGWNSLCAPRTKITLTNLENGSYSISNPEGDKLTIHTSANTNTYDNNSSLLNAVTVQEAIDQVHAIAQKDDNPHNEIQNLQEVINENPSAGNQNITELADPVNNQDAATKNYIDNAITNSDDNDEDKITGNEIVNATDSTLRRSGSGTAADPYTIDVADNGIDTNELADKSVTNSKIANRAVNLDHLKEGSSVGQLMQWNGASWVLVGTSSIDNQNANEVSIVDAGNNFGATTVEAALSEINSKLTANYINIADTSNNFSANTVESALTELHNYIEVVENADNDSTTGNEILDATDNTLIRSGAGTTSSPYTLDVADNGIGTNELTDSAVTTNKISSGDNNSVLITNNTGNVSWQDQDTFGQNILANMPVIYAAGRHEADELSDNTPKSVYNATIIRTSQGIFEINFINDIGTSNYIIQLSVENCNGDCPDNGSNRHDAPSIVYSNVTSTGFTVTTGDNDNGASNVALADLGFMFSVIKLPNIN